MIATVRSLAAAGRRDWTRLTAPLLLLAVLLAYGTLWGYKQFGEVIWRILRHAFPSRPRTRGFASDNEGGAGRWPAG